MNANTKKYLVPKNSLDADAQHYVDVCNNSNLPKRCYCAILEGQTSGAVYAFNFRQWRKVRRIVARVSKNEAISIKVVRFNEDK